MREKLLKHIVLAVCLVSVGPVFSLNDEESCVSYGPGAGSHVYPVGSKSDGHQLQYTKAVSEYMFHPIISYFASCNFPTKID